jgi:hypothetical protein
VAKLTPNMRTALLWFGWGEFTNNTEWMATPRYLFDFGGIRLYPQLDTGALIHISGRTIEQLVTLEYLTPTKAGNLVTLRLASNHRGYWIKEGAKLDWRHKQCERLGQQIDTLDNRIDRLQRVLSQQIGGAAAPRSKNAATTLAKALAPAIARLSSHYRQHQEGQRKLQILRKQYEAAMKREPTEEQLIVYMVSKKLDNPDGE